MAASTARAARVHASAVASVSVNAKGTLASRIGSNSAATAISAVARKRRLRCCVAA